MATDVINLQKKDVVTSQPGSSKGYLQNETLAFLLTPLASLRLTVALFAASIFIILVGTLAQYNQDMWEVIDRYFAAWFTLIEVRVFFPRSFFPSWPSYLPDPRSSAFAFPFLGGASIGLAMVVNLLAAHILRFRIQAKGQRLWVGFILIAAGVWMAWLVIVSGHNHDGLQTASPFDDWMTLWQIVRYAVFGVTILSAVSLVVLWMRSSNRQVELWSLAVLTLCMIGLSIVLIRGKGDTYIGSSGMRILWQLILAAASSSVLLAGCYALFKKRAGIVLLHGGIGLMMFGQFYVSNYDVEEQLSMAEGQTVNYAQDIRAVELAVIDREHPDHPNENIEVVVPLSRNGTASKYVSEEYVRHDDLPFDLRIEKLIHSSVIEPASDHEENVATDGRGAGYVARAARGASGAGGASNVDLASVYVTIRESGESDPFGTYLLSQAYYEIPNSARIVTLDKEEIDFGDKKYDLEIRFKRNYKPYSLHLIDVRKDDYMGTSTPRNYSSDVRLVDAERNMDRKLHVWMNNPLRYAGETFYQSNYQADRAGNEYSTLSVVKNSGWMIPYVSCVIVGFGMLFQFSVVLLRFLKRRNQRPQTSNTDVAMRFPGIVALTRGQLLVSNREEAGNVDGSTNRAKGLRKGAKQKSSRPRVPSWENASWAVRIGAIFPLIIVLLAAVFMLDRSSLPEVDKGAMNLRAFGRLPLVYKGRVKPFDTLARNALLIISGKQTFKAQMDEQELRANWDEIRTRLVEKWNELQAGPLNQFQGDANDLVDFVVDNTNTSRMQADAYIYKLTSYRQPAIRWLLDVITGTEVARRHRVFRIDNLDVLQTLGLERRKGFRYALDEFWPKIGDFERQAREAALLNRENPEALSFYQRKLLETDKKFRTLTLLHATFTPPGPSELPELPTVDDMQNDRSKALAQLQEFRRAMDSRSRSLLSMEPPRAIPPSEEGGDWQPYATAWLWSYLYTKFGQPSDPATYAMSNILVSYAEGNVTQFNSEVAKYQASLTNDPPAELQSTASMTGGLLKSSFDTFYHFESYFNHFSPFFWCKWLYVVAFVLSAIAWLGWSMPLNRAAFWLIVLTLAIHTWALIARIYISGRPPVTNLYSSAVFIGWGCVILGLVLETLYRSGVGSVIAAVIGFATLQIAHYLALDGDTIAVLQAVLDTNFWLTTHVVCITLGYATTFLAGGLGLLYVLRGLFTSSLTKAASKDLSRMIYGVICFATFFSFIGTVLGGLWADDSWGRFWGWDPKENGALIIVLWNALVLHARWGGMVKERGLAVLSIGGNIVTAWSWFGVNELGVGLHSYGFTEGVLKALAVFVASQLAVIFIGMIPLTYWASFRDPKTGTGPVSS